MHNLLHLIEIRREANKEKKGLNKLTPIITKIIFVWKRCVCVCEMRIMYTNRLSRVEITICCCCCCWCFLRWFPALAVPHAGAYPQTQTQPSCICNVFWFSENKFNSWKVRGSSELGMHMNHCFWIRCSRLRYTHTKLCYTIWFVIPVLGTEDWTSNRLCIWFDDV